MKADNAVDYIDFDYASNFNKRWIFSSYVFILCNSAISWKASLKFIVELSTTKAEYIAIIEGVKEAIWLKGLVSDHSLIQAVIVFNDSQSAIYLTKNKSIMK